MLVEALGVQLLTIPYKGTAPAMNDLLGKQVDMLCDQTTNTTNRSTAVSRPMPSPVSSACPPC